MGKNQSASNLPNIIQYNNGSINFVSGSTLLMQISSSGAITTTGVISGSNALSSSYAVSSSYSQNSELLDNLDSTAFVFTSSYNSDSSSVSTRTTNLESTASVLTTASASFATVSGSYSTASGSLSTRVTNIEGNYATTGSNVFMGAQTVCANITSTGTIVAQTLNVQQVTSSIVYSCGSNTFGCALTDVQQITGSLRVTGSGNHYIIGGSVGIGTTTPDAAASLSVNKTGAGLQDLIYLTNTQAAAADTGANLWWLGGPSLNSLGRIAMGWTGTTTTTSYMALYTRGDGSTTEKVRITSSGSVGINTNAPINKLDIRVSDSTAYLGTCTGNVLTVYNTCAVANGFAGIDLIAEPATGNAARAAINVIATGNGTADLAFGTRNTTMGERMRITSDGNVYIGATSGDYGKLDVTVSPSSYTAALGLGVRTNSSEGNSVGISFKTKVSLGGVIWENARIAAITTGVASSAYGELGFYTMNATTLSERMRITSAGNVGIGISSPYVTLQVASPYLKTSATQCALFFIGTCDVSNPWGLRVKPIGASAIGNRYVEFQTTEVNVADGGNIIFQNGGGNVGIGSNIATTKLRVFGAIGNGTSTYPHNVRLVKTGSTSVTFTINLPYASNWTAGYATIRVAGSRTGLEEQYAAMYFVRLTYYAGSVSAVVNNVSGDTGSATVSISASAPGDSVLTITITDSGSTTDYLIADIDGSFYGGVLSIS